MFYGIADSNTDYCIENEYDPFIIEYNNFCKINEAVLYLQEKKVKVDINNNTFSQKASEIFEKFKTWALEMLRKFDELLIRIRIVAANIIRQFISIIMPFLYKDDIFGKHAGIVYNNLGDDTYYVLQIIKTSPLSPDRIPDPEDYIKKKHNSSFYDNNEVFVNFFKKIEKIKETKDTNQIPLLIAPGMDLNLVNVVAFKLIPGQYKERMQDFVSFIQEDNKLYNKTVDLLQRKIKKAENMISHLKDIDYATASAEDKAIYTNGTNYIFTLRTIVNIYAQILKINTLTLRMFATNIGYIRTLIMRQKTWTDKEPQSSSILRQRAQNAFAPETDDLFD